MEKSESRKGKLPACVLNRELIEELWSILGQDGEFIWQVLIGTGNDDILGKKAERPQEIVIDKDQLLALLDSLPRIDSLQITAEMAGKGAISLSYKNYAPPAGALVVSGYELAWVETKFDAIMDLFDSVTQDTQMKLYSFLIFGTIQTVIPLTLGFILVMAVAILIPSSIRHSEFLWWITTGTVVATLRVAYSISDWMVKYVLERYPYIRWLS